MGALDACPAAEGTPRGDVAAGRPIAADAWYCGCCGLVLPDTVGDAAEMPDAFAPPSAAAPDDVPATLSTDRGVMPPDDAPTA